MRSSAALALIAALVFAQGAFAQTTYQTPSQELVDVVDAPTTPLLSIDPTHRHFALLDTPSLPGLSELAQPELKLAGLRLSPATRGPSRARFVNGISFQDLDAAPGAERRVTGLPEDARLGNPRWSPDGRFLAVTHTAYGEDFASSRIELWIAEVETASARRLGEIELTMSSQTAPQWAPDSGSLYVLATPTEIGVAPSRARLPAGPTIEQSTGKKAPARTYQDLLADAHDEALFEHYLLSSINRVDLDGKATHLAGPAMYWDLAVSPSGEYLLAEAVHEPFSYRVPASRFPRVIEVLDRSGQGVYQLADLPLQEEVPMTFGSVPEGPRRVEWRSDSPATLAWAEALDGGDARARADERDRLFTLEAPFDGEPAILATLGLRYAGTIWGDGQIAFVNESWWLTRQTRSWRVAPDEPGGEPLLLVDRSFEDRYSDPGSPETKANGVGHRVAMLGGAGDTVFLLGRGASPEGDQPFFDSVDLSSGDFSAGGKQRYFQSEAPHYEQPIQLLDLDKKGRPWRLITRRESVEEPPNYFLRDLRKGRERQLTDFQHPTPQLKGYQKELIRYQREDGVDLTATLYLPSEWQEGDDPLPMLLWAYPIEFKSADAAGQVQGSPHRFDRINHWSPMIWLARGYAVLDDPTMPIIGEGDVEPNDTYVEQLVASAEAAVAEVVRRGVAERGRIAIGGHSYGAFMTANLLAHSDLFAAGIARSGAFNRTLTPWGFQAEQRSFWEAPEVYFAMSPFMHAEKVNEPILLIHGEMDNNSGTFPVQSQRYFAALKGHGATARLVMLPYESHGYRARESLLHMLWEQEQWLERYLGGRKSSGSSSATAEP